MPEPLPSTSSPNQDPTLDKLLDMYFPVVKEKILLRASEIAGTRSPNAKDFMAAIQEYIPGEPYVHVKQRWSWINQNVTGFMAITAMMTAIFGVMGVSQPGQTSFLEIAKIFAGALVGGAAGAAAGSRRT